MSQSFLLLSQKLQHPSLPYRCLRIGFAHFVRGVFERLSGYADCGESFQHQRQESGNLFLELRCLFGAFQEECFAGSHSLFPGRLHCALPSLHSPLRMLFQIFPASLQENLPKEVLFLALQAFVEAFQGCYKDGTEPGTCNCRFVAALNLFFRVCLYLSYTVVLGHHYFLFTISLSLVYAVFIAILRPYKRQYSAQNVIEPLFLMLFCMLQIAMFGFVFLQTERRNWLLSIYIFISIISIIPLLYLTGLILHWLSKTKLFQKAETRVVHLFGRRSSARNSELSEEDEDSFDAYIVRLGNKNYGSNARTQNEMVMAQN